MGGGVWGCGWGGSVFDAVGLAGYFCGFVLFGQPAFLVTTPIQVALYTAACV